PVTAERERGFKSVERERANGGRLPEDLGSASGSQTETVIVRAGGHEETAAQPGGGPQFVLAPHPIAITPTLGPVATTAPPSSLFADSPLITTLTSTLATLTATLSSQQSDLSRLSTSLSTSLADNVALRNQIADLKRERQLLKRDVERRNEQIEDLVARVNDAELAARAASVP
ncbi:hypothetical protein HDU93_002564, partial [Gonapodya sp. JEL0774]